jgi:hypothetical protein
MKYHQLIAHNVDCLPLLHAIQRQPELFNEDRFRTTYENTPNVDVSDILIRYSDTKVKDTTTAVIGDNGPVWRDAARKLPQFWPIVKSLMQRVDAYELGRVIISKVPPGGRVLPHADNIGAYCDVSDRSRYHVILQGFPGNLYTTGDETVEMRTGEIWWFDARAMHSVHNQSTDDRIHMIVDVRSFQ